MCLECGMVLRSLLTHIVRHGLDCAEYREEWGYPSAQPLDVSELRPATDLASTAEASRGGRGRRNGRRQVS